MMRFDGGRIIRRRHGVKRH